MARLDDQAEIRRKGARISSSSSLIVRVGPGHVVGGLAWPLEHLALVVGTILVLDFLSHGLDFVYGVRDTDEVAPSDAVQRVTRRTDFAVDLVAPSNATEYFSFVREGCVLG